MSVIDDSVNVAANAKKWRWKSESLQAVDLEFFRLTRKKSAPVASSRSRPSAHYTTFHTTFQSTAHVVLHSTTLHCISLPPLPAAKAGSAHCPAQLHCKTLHCTAVNYITRNYTTLHSTTLHTTFNYTLINYLHCTSFNYIAMNKTQLEWAPLNYIAKLHSSKTAMNDTHLHWL